MNEYDPLTRDELISLIRELKADPRRERGPVPGNPEGFPVFGEQQLRQFEASPHAMRIAEHGTLRYLAVNAAALKLYGYNREEFLKLTLRDTRRPDEHAEQAASFAAPTGSLRHSAIRRHIKKSGEIIFVEVITQDILFDGRPARLSLTVDVTARLRVQELLWQRQQEFESLAENLPDLVARFDRERRYVYVNAAVEKLTGKARDDIIGRTQRELGMPDDLITTFEESLTDVLSAGRTHSLEFRFPAPDGERLFEAFHVPERDQTGEIATVLCVARDITRRKRTHDALRESREQYRAVTETANDAIVSADGNGNIIYFNQAASRTFGYAVEEAIGRPLTLLMPARFHADHKAGLRRFLDGQTPTMIGKTMELVGRRKDGTEFPVEVSLASWRTSASVFFTGILRDITERKRAAQALSETNEFLRSVIDSSRDCIKVLHLDGRLQWISTGGQRLMETDDEAPFLNRSYLDFWSGAERELARNALAAACSGSTSNFEGYCPTVKGTPKWWDEIMTPILDAEGKPEKVLVVSRDITRRRAVENALRESEERFRQLAENIREVFWISHPNGDNIYVSPAYEEIWDRSRESLYRNPRSWMEPIHPDDLPSVQECQKKMARGQLTDVEYRITRPDGTPRWIRDRSYPMKRDDGTRLVCGIAEDITNRKRAEEERLAHAILQRDALVREVHHRIKNSLQGIVGLLRQRIRNKPAIAPEIEETIAQLQSVALVYGLQETRPDGLLSLADITEAICSSAESLIGGRVERAFERKSQRPACLAGAEAVSVAVALNELVFNALKHQPAAAGKKRARLVLREAKDEAEIRISNRGRLPKGFDFAENRAVGSGLGLVRTLLAPPGGSIAFNGGRNEVEVVLKLQPPLLAERQTMGGR